MSWVFVAGSGLVLILDQTRAGSETSPKSVLIAAIGIWEHSECGDVPAIGISAFTDATLIVHVIGVALIYEPWIGPGYGYWKHGTIDEWQ